MIESNAARTAPVIGNEDFLQEAFAHLDGKELVAHFRQRDNVHFFPPSKGSPTRVERADRVLHNEFTFNNESHRLPDPFDWLINPSHDIEWLIALHKFYYAKDLGAAYAYSGDERYARKWVALVESWIDQVPLGYIDSQVTGRRLQQWIQSFYSFLPGKDCASISSRFVIKFLRSLRDQARYLSKHLSAEGNHRTIELYGIFLVAILFPELRGSDGLLTFAKRELLANLREDLLSDGVHRELSTEYHHTVLENYLRVRRVATLNGLTLPEEFDRLVQRAIQFSLYVHKPDGTIPAINDADWKGFVSVLKQAHECYPDPHLRYVTSRGLEGVPPPSRSVTFSASGYTILRSDWAAQPYGDAQYLFFDCGPVGAGTHGHYDLLNIELAAYGHSLIVDPGRYTYSEQGTDGVNWRKTFRGTAMHNTIVVDGKDQTPYRLTNIPEIQAKARLLEFATHSGFDFVHGVAHSDRYPVVHERKIFFVHPQYWIIVDRLEAAGTHNYDLRFHLHPRALAQTQVQFARETSSVRSENLVVAQARCADVTLTLEDGFVAPCYGVKQAAPVIRYSRRATGPAILQTVIYPFPATPPTLAVEELSVRRNGVVCAPYQASALKITLDGEGGRFTDHFFLAHGETDQYEVDDIRIHGKLLYLRRDWRGETINLQVAHTDLVAAGGKLIMG